MGRFQLNIYEKRKPQKGKAIKKKEFDSPKQARLSTLAQKAVYYEVVDKRDKRIIEVKIEGQE